jgi:hypothetical protein
MTFFYPFLVFYGASVVLALLVAVRTITMRVPAAVAAPRARQQTDLAPQPVVAAPAPKVATPFVAKPVMVAAPVVPAPAAAAPRVTTANKNVVRRPAASTPPLVPGTVSRVGAALQRLATNLLRDFDGAEPTSVEEERTTIWSTAQQRRMAC